MPRNRSVNVLVRVGYFFHGVPVVGVARFDGLFCAAQVVVHGRGRHALARSRAGCKLEINHVIGVKIARRGAFIRGIQNKKIHIIG